MAVPLGRRIGALFNIRRGSFAAFKNPSKLQRSCLITLEYCSQCNYKPYAAILQKRLEDVRGVKVLVSSSKTIGAFEVTAHADGQAVVLWSKLQSGMPVHMGSAEAVAEIVKLDVIDMMKEDIGSSKLPIVDHVTAKGILERVRVRHMVQACEP
eukprot:jgi/Botrbrau1/126/Bobra.0022s0112.1